MSNLLGLADGLAVGLTMVGLSVEVDVVGDLLRLADGLLVGVDVVGDWVGLAVGLAVEVEVMEIHLDLKLGWHWLDLML